MNTEQERADFEKWAENTEHRSERNMFERGEFEAALGRGKTYDERDFQMYLLGRRAALQSQDEDIFSPTSLTGLSKDELIRQLQWALNYWMPNIADDGTPDGERAAREAYLLLGMQAPVGREEENTPTYWERVSDLQSQDREDAGMAEIVREAAQIIAAIPPEHAPDNIRWPIVDELEGFASMIDHARRVEGGGM